jgi:hypothetical protein
MSRSNAMMILLPGFLLATKIWGGSAINEWAYVACQIPWDVFSESLWITSDEKVVDLRL